MERKKKKPGNSIPKEKSALQLERQNQRIVPLPHFLARMLRFTGVALLLIAFSLSIGTFGYHHFAQLSWLDSFHMSSLILTGMGPVEEMKTVGAKLFSSFYALYSGIAFLSSSAVFFAPVIHRLLHILHFDPDSGAEE